VAYPDYKWIIGRFKFSSNHIWKDRNSVREFFQFCKNELQITNKEDWYRVSRVQISHLGGQHLIQLYGNLRNALSFGFPEENWDLEQFSIQGKKSVQRLLSVMVSQLLPSATVFEDYQHPLLYWEESSKNKMQFDIWVPQFNLAIEYQGEQHFHDLHKAFGPGGISSLYSEKDNFKKQKASENRVKFLTIPYWWDGTQQSLAATLCQHFPEIFPPSSGSPIPATIPAFLSRNQNL